MSNKAVAPTNANNAAAHAAKTEAEIDSAVTAVRGLSGALIAIGLLTVILNGLWIRELLRPVGQRFAPDPEAPKLYPNRTALRYLLVLALGFAVLGALISVAMSSALVAMVNTANAARNQS